MQQERGLARAVGVGWWMALALGVGTAVEYLLFLVMDSNLPIMVAVNVVEAALIMTYFMHIPRLWRREEEEEE